MSRQVAAYKRVSLAGMADGWGDDCFAVMMPASYTDMAAVDALDPTDKVQAAKFQEDFVVRHFIRGRIMVVGESGASIEDMQPDDANCTKEISDKLFAAIVGIDIDPKATLPEHGSTSEPQKSADSTDLPS